MEVSFQETLAAQQTHRLLATNSYNYLFVETLKKAPVQTKTVPGKKKACSGKWSCDLWVRKCTSREPEACTP